MTTTTTNNMTDMTETPNPEKKIILKVAFGEDVRRVTIPVNKLVWEDLVNNIIFNRLGICLNTVQEYCRTAHGTPISARYRLTYKDDYSEEITISSQEELQEAIDLTLKAGQDILRFTVVVRRDPTLYESFESFDD